MKKFFLFTLAVLAFVACAQNDVEELSANRADAPETLTVGFEGADDDTRIQLNSNQKTVWNENDNITVFYHSDANQKWQYQGETGERQGQFKRLQNAESTTKIANIVVAYPYSEDYFLNTQSYNIEAMLPAVQHYAEDSYGVGDNLMVSQSEFTQFSLKSVCGWLKIQLTGNGERVTHLVLRGNNEEQLAGLIYVDTATAEATLVAEMGGFDDVENSVGGGLVPDNSLVKSITLNCGEGVTLGAKATAFYIALPPQTFDKGITVEIEDIDGYVMEQSTDKVVSIERNHIHPMSVVEFVNPNTPSTPKPTNSEIWYTATSKVEPYWDDVFGATLISNNFDSTTGKGIIIFDNDVTSIGEQAFYSCSSLTGVTIPDSVTTIGDEAFEDCSSLTSVTIPDSVTTIGYRAFRDCYSLTSVTIGDSVTTIGDEAFEDCSSLTSVTIPDSVTTIGYRAFRDCYSLTSVTIGDSVTTIGDDAFYYCSSLTSLTIGDSVMTIGKWAFSDCYSLTSVTIPDSVTTIGDLAFLSCSSLTEFKGKFAEDNGRILVIDGTLVAFAPAGLTEYAIPDSVTTIGNYAFAYCSSLTSITIPDSVTTIGGAAFRGCDSLTSITIPDSVTTIGDFAFYDCSSLKKVYCNAIIPPSIGGSVFSYNATGRKIYVYDECVDLYKSLWSSYADSIYSNSKNCPYTTTIEYTTSGGAIISVTRLPIISNTYEDGIGKLVVAVNSNYQIPESAFEDCYSLTSVTIPDSVTTIGDRAFYACSSLTSVTIGDSVTTIGVDAFASCSSLTSITIPDSVTTIGDRAFYDCDSLTSITIPDSVTTIGDDAFYDCDSLTSVTIPDSVTTIGDGAFNGCSGLTSITIPDSVTTIGNYAFYDCDSLTSVTIGDSVTTIGDGAFDDCSSLTSVTIGDSVTTIGNYAFYYCTSLTSVTIPDSVTTIGGGAFYGCDSLTSVTIPDSVTTIGNAAFSSCDSLAEFKGKFAENNGRIWVVDGTLVTFAPAGLTEYAIPDSVTTIGGEAFSSCDSLTSVTIPDSVTTIGYEAFYRCDSLTSVTIGDNVTTIGNSAFCYCSSLTSVYCKATTPPALGNTCVFDYYDSGRKIYVPTESVEAYKSAKYWSNYADAIVGYDFENDKVVE